jgi:hypothetical protein
MTAIEWLVEQLEEDDSKIRLSLDFTLKVKLPK